MKIASWNINSLRKRQQRLLDWLAKEEPDVVCLQETKCSDDQFPELALSAARYRCVFHGQKSYNGVAILSRHELRERQAALCDKSEDPQARVIAATIKDVRVFSVYAPNGQVVGSPAFNNKLVCAIPFAFIMPKAVFSVGGIIGCWRFKRIADYASMRSWRVNLWPNVAPRRGSIAKCVKARIRPITPRCGRSLSCRGACLC